MKPKEDKIPKLQLKKSKKLKGKKFQINFNLQTDTKKLYLQNQ
jgi:hypothetical protein